MSGYIGTQPVPQATQTRDSFTATSGQTSFATGGYTPNFLDVYLNGVKLASADYTATNGSDVVLASGASTGDILEVVAFTTFNSASSSIDDNGNATAITIDINENVLVGQTTNALADTGHILDSTGTAYHIRDGASPLILNRKSSDGSIAEFYKDGTTVGSIGSSNTGERLYIVNDSTGLSFIGDFSNIFPCDSTGTARDNAINLGGVGGRFKDLYLSGGIYLGGTGSANKLDDYETGSWTPAFSGASTNTGASNSGTYIKIGRLVHCTFNINQSALTGNSTATMTGLPFNCANVSNVNAFSIQDCGHTLNTVSSNNGRFRCVPLNATLQGVKSLGSTTYMTYNEFYDGSGSLEIRGHFTYLSA